MLTAMLAAAVVCGPPGAATLAQGDVARVFSTRDAVRGCVRSWRGSWRLGVAGRVTGARVAGRYALLRRPGEVLTVYDLRRRRRNGSAHGQGHVPLEFTAVRLYRSGIAAYAARAPGGHVAINTTAGAWGFEGNDISPGYVAMAGYVLAWRRSDGLEVQFEDGYPAWPARPLLRGRVTVDVNDGSWLRARLRGRRPVALGEAASPCISSSGCSGVNRIQIAGRFAAARSWDADPVAEQYVGAVTVADLRTRSRRTTCRSEQVHEYVLTDDGAMACLVNTGEFPHSQEIRSEGEVLYAGTGISDLHRRGEELVWLHGGTERTAPLPRRG
jgi:hypothetical protein